MQEIRKIRKSEKVGIWKEEKNQGTRNSEKVRNQRERIKQGKNIDHLGHG